MSNSSDSETSSPYSTSPQQYPFATPNYRLHHPPHRQEGQEGQEGQAYPPPLPGFHYGTSPHGNANSASNFRPSSSTAANSKVASTPNHHFPGFGIDQYHYVMHHACTQTSPYFGPPPPPLMPPLPPPGSWTVTPNAAVTRNKSSSTIYQQSPYFSDAPALLGTCSGGSSESSTTSTTATACRPAPAKSAFMCFSDAKSEDIREKMGPHTKGGLVEAVAAEWRKLPPKARAHWEEMAEREKKRFATERDALCKAHKGPVVRKLRAKKNPLAPKRPMSAFLMYAQQKRRLMQIENPNMPNSDISRLLGEMWRNASPSEKRPHMEREEVERKLYKAKVEKWKNDEKLEKAMKPLTPRSHGVTAPMLMATAERTSGDPRELDRRQDVATFLQEGEESHSRFDPGQSTLLSLTSDVKNEYWYQQETPPLYQHRTSNSSPYEHRYDSSPWSEGPPPTPLTATTAATAKALHDLKREEKFSSARVVHYSYPRPPE